MSHTLGQLATKVQGVVKGDECLLIEKLGTLEKATKTELSFLANPKYQHQLTSTSAGAVLVKTEELAQLVDNAIVVPNPYLAFAQLSHLFVPSTQSWKGIHPSAVISTNVIIADDVTIGPNVVIDDDVTIAEGCVIGAGCVIGRGVKVGKGTQLYPNVTFYHDVIIGDNCIFHSNSVIGADGFGFAPKVGGWEKINQLGAVIIGDNVEIGASTTIDRGALENTQIGCGVKIDNQVQIAHNVIIGDNTAIAACTAIAGSTKIGSFCTISGGVCIAGHLTIADSVHITGMSMISNSVAEAGSYSSGMGMEPTGKWRRTVARVRRIDEMAKQFAQLKQQVNKFLEKVDK
ncbi:UDP-3-O-(3-hydroxymyristoyl)glucosamine N-acyltransferase [Marinomonas rhizomae]|uniref:UDP-3-O-acylglucosamine N-acyltransferase n=1 Tax=Marinomonas rhizomae TaxID=491948 RepID=A0A366J6R3_9GAMM|nr:UDP-3-O-(3-hydroxymyristoyl)glucosamine N-acyltransferase [Marinomonas rhizomae]RBP81895.1 UDP-3-O-[3-hydroxymyristoyl] glucosamine N-acyltransferase [Marinomonas rhizomae]RNF73011.1 UDP-3-O-(3-hydroxymyristoyl)glucosamine N-acyltransferase [Marinomonas rhizomae]